MSRIRCTSRNPHIPLSISFSYFALDFIHVLVGYFIRDFHLASDQYFDRLTNFTFGRYERYVYRFKVKFKLND